ncbi:MAG: hypothetical protein JNL40_01685 [Cyclobacteriaceae bacterium]|nr:hypothetical protein [Cyclobacteriaceae bacterium]
MAKSHFCEECRVSIEVEVHDYSMDKFGRALCRKHQEVRRKRTWSPKRTPEADKLGKALMERGWNVTFEKDDGYKHIDLSIDEAKIHIEVDGFTHTVNARRALADLERSYYDFLKGYLTLHIPNCLVEDDRILNKTADLISMFIEAKRKLK